MADEDKRGDIVGWRFRTPHPGGQPGIFLSWLVGIPDEFDAYRRLMPGAVSMAAELTPEPIDSAEASVLELRHGEVRRES
jgi:hypothetical protein